MFVTSTAGADYLFTEAAKTVVALPAQLLAVCFSVIPSLAAYVCLVLFEGDATLLRSRHVSRVLPALSSHV